MLLAHQDVGPLKLFATSRKGEPLGFSLRDSATQEVVYPSLDVEQPESIRSLAARVTKESETGKIDVLINNAGVYVPVEGPDALSHAEKTLRVNYWGVKEMCENVIPHLSTNGRIVNVSSQSSHINEYGANIRARFRNPDITFPELEALLDDYLSSVQNTPQANDENANDANANNENTNDEKAIDENSFGPPDRAYNVSKAGVNVLTHIYAREHPGLSIHACCPGWVRTDMGYQVGPEPPKSLEDGVRIPLRLAFGDLDGQPRGGFWANSSARISGDGGLRVWAEDGSHVFA